MIPNPPGESSTGGVVGGGVDKLEKFKKDNEAIFTAVKKFQDTREKADAAQKALSKADAALKKTPGDKQAQRARVEADKKQRAANKNKLAAQEESQKTIKQLMKNMRDVPSEYVVNVQRNGWVSAVLQSFFDKSADPEIIPLLDESTSKSLRQEPGAWEPEVKVVDIGSALGLSMSVMEGFPSVISMPDAAQVLGVYNDWIGALGMDISVTCLIFGSRSFWLGSTLAAPKKLKGKKAEGKKEALEYRHKSLKAALEKHGLTLPALRPRLQISLVDSLGSFYIKKFLPTVKTLDPKLVKYLFQLCRAVVGDTDGLKNPAWNCRDQSDFNQIRNQIALEYDPNSTNHFKEQFTFEKFEEKIAEFLGKDHEAAYGDCAETYPLICFLSDTKPSPNSGKLSSPFARYEGLAVDTTWDGLGEKKRPCTNCAALLDHLGFLAQSYNSQLDPPGEAYAYHKFVIWDWDLASDGVTRDPSKKGPPWDHAKSAKGVP